MEGEKPGAEVSVEAVSAEVVAETEGAEVGAGVEGEKPGVEVSVEAVSAEAVSEGGDIKTMARVLYRLGLEAGLGRDEAALQASETKFPAFIGEEDYRKFKEELFDAYREAFENHLQDLRRQMDI